VIQSLGSYIPAGVMQFPGPLVQPSLGADGKWSAYPSPLPNFKTALHSYKDEDSLIALRIARNYEAANLFRHAYLAYWEHFYAERPFSRLARLPGAEAFPKGTQLSDEMAFVWERMAVNARQGGDTDLAQAFLARAAVFGDDACFRRCVSLWADWRRGDSAPGKGGAEDVLEEVKRRLLRENVDLYMEVSLHPRAWALVEEMPEHFDEPVGLATRIKQSWREASHAADHLTRPLYRYGKRIDKEEDLYDIFIPWPCSPEAAATYSDLWDESWP